jgi:putative transposase
MRFEFIHAEKAFFAVSALCRVLGVSRQGYYAWANRPESARRQSDRVLEERVRAVHESSRGTYGSPRVQAALRHQGLRVGKRRIERSMRQLGLHGRRPRRFRTTTVRDGEHPVAPNTLDREFRAAHPNAAWVTDITYVRTTQGFSYLAVIIDLFSRAVVGWAVDTDMSTALVLRALQMALLHRDPPEGLLHHSDRGCQYTSRAYREALAEAGIGASMSRKGNCWDNAVAESFFSTIKAELLDGTQWTSNAQLRAALFDYIEVFYNRQRLHSTLGYISPAEAETRYDAATAA